MRKYLSLLAVGALALTACTSEDVVDDVAKTRNLISFENAVNKQSRVEDLSSSTLLNFNVFGFYTMPDNPNVANEVFDDVVVTKQSYGSWTTAEERYWVKGARYYFYAYSCGANPLDTDKYGKFDLDMDNSETTDEDGNKVVGKPASERVLNLNGYLCDNTHQHDLVFASNTGAVEGNPYAGILGQESGNETVSLQFRHILTKVAARFTSKFPQEYEVRIKNVTIQDVRNQGNYNPVDGWTGVVRKAGIPYVDLLDNNESTLQVITVKNEQKDGVQAFADTEAAYVIPTSVDDKTTTLTDKDVAINFTIDLYFGDDKVMTKQLHGTFVPTWQEGYSYIYNIELSGSTTNMQAIAFTVLTDNNLVISDWQTEKDEEGTPVFHEIPIDD